MVVRTENRRENPQSETLTTPQPALPAQSLFVGLPGAYEPQGFAPLSFAPVATPFGTQPIGFAPFPGFAGQGLYAAQPAPWYGAFQGQPFQGQPLQGIAPANLQSLPPLGAPLGAALPGQSIPVAVQDLGREVVATFEVPGIAPADLSIVVGNTSVTLRTLRPAANGRVYQGTFALPAEVLPSQASARLENGLLVLTLPRRTPTEEPRRVEIEA